jgi:hypothetical protein
MEKTYEGFVKYADDSVVSLQCFELRCDECPDTETTSDGVLDGYNCECPHHQGTEEA